MMAAPAPTKRKIPAPKWINAPKLAFQTGSSSSSSSSGRRRRRTSENEE